MSQKYLSIIVAALFFCIIGSLVLVSRINDARVNLAHSTPQAFNSLLQNTRNINVFVDALIEATANQNNAETAQKLRNNYIKRFDVVWGGFTVFNVIFQSRPEQQQQANELLEYAVNFLNENEHLMDHAYELTDDEVQDLIIGVQSISEKIINLGHQYFIYTTQFTDLWDDRLHRLYQLFWVFVALLLITTALLAEVFLRSARQSAKLVEKSNKTQQEMKILIDELRSGRLENKAKDNFIAAASHDLRQPLHALGLFLGATERHIDNDAGHKALAKAKNCTVELNRLFNSLLDLSRLDAGVVEANKTEFQLNSLLGLIEQDFSATAKQNGVEFKVCRKHYTVNTDTLLLTRILRNLLENAFSHSGATDIQIFCESAGDNVRISVADNGSGIPTTEQSDIFSEYYQLDNPDRDRSKGLGLGLSIVKRLCEILEIGISLESKLGTGTMFHLEMPMSKASIQSVAKAAETAIENAPMPEGILVSVIDDDVNVRQGMVYMLESLNFNVIAAESAVEMISILEQKQLTPDILIADYRLKENQTGDVAIHRVRSAIDAEFPAMIITGDTSPSRMIDAANSGFELLHKPVGPKELMGRITTLLSSAKKADNQMSIN